MKKIILLPMLLLSACTSVNINPLDASYKVKEICIRENPKVHIEELVEVIANNLKRHNIDSRFVKSQVDKNALEADKQSDQYFMNLTPTPEDCAFNLTYTARNSRDFAPFLTSALINISDKTQLIAHAEYHLKINGGLSFKKWASVKTKIDPVMDELLQNYP